ncbi:MAG: class I SAM-dependent methyltransferase [Actinomycetota bacterium]|nr:class I SAM-dependent methyltransferase [Actinomycetota bacterium]
MTDSGGPARGRVWQLMGSATGAPSWDELAPWWRETFTHGADLEYEQQILPLALSHLAGRRRILDLGTGEGQLARRLVESDSRRVVVGLDSSAAQLANARAEGGGPSWVRAAGERLPFADGSFDAVVCCLVIEHAADADAVLGEVARVLDGGGLFLLLINHPIVQGPGSGLVDDTILGERYWRIGPYLQETRNLEQVDSGVQVAFAHRPLSRYINPLAASGLFLARMEEPEPPVEFLAGSLDTDFERSMPRLCLLRFENR